SAFAHYTARFDPVTDPRLRRLLTYEVVVVLAVTFGLSGLYSVLDLVSALLVPEPLADQTATLNAARSTHTWLDLAYQLLGLARARPGRQAGLALLRTAVIGIPGLALCLGAVAAGANLQVAASGLTESWWRPVVLVLSAVGNGAAEEILVVGYLLVRLRQIG